MSDKKIEIVLEKQVDIEEFKKIIGFISEDITDYSFCDNKIYICLNDYSYEKEIADQVLEMSKKYVSNNEIEKLVYCNRNKKEIYFNNFQTVHYFDNGMISLSKQSRFIYLFFEQTIIDIINNCFKNRECDILSKIYPVMLPIKSYKKTGYLKRTPQYSFFCCSLCENISKLNSLKNDEYKKMLKTPKYSLSPSACFHVYEEYKNTELERNTVITFTQSVFRNEGRFNFQEFGRMRDYHVREIVFIGSEDFVKNSRQLFIDKVKEIIEKMKIDAKISIASDSFILPHMQKYKKIQIIDNSKYELSFFYDEEHSVSVGSFNLHGTAFTVPFNFSVKDTETVTGCIGFGLERLVLTFLSQFGENEQNWPEEIRKKYEEIK